MPLKNALSNFPTIVSFDENELPALTKWKVGGKYHLMLEVEQTSMSKGQDYPEDSKESKKPKMRASFKVLSVKSTDGHKYGNMELKKQAIANRIK